jgi:malonate transporter and related proteins
LSLDGMRANIGPASLLAVVKLIVLPVIVYGLCLVLHLEPLYMVAAVICAAVPTAKTVYILAGEYRCEQILVASTVSLTTVASIVSLVVWLYALNNIAARIAVP